MQPDPKVDHDTLEKLRTIDALPYGSPSLTHEFEQDFAELRAGREAWAALPLYRRVIRRARLVPGNLIDWLVHG